MRPNLSRIALIFAVIAVFLICQDPPPESANQPQAGDVYPWTEGSTERTAEIIRFDETENGPVPVFYDHRTRVEMTMHGEVILTVNHGVTAEQLEQILERDGLSEVSNPQELMRNTFMVHTPAGAAGVVAAARLQKQPEIRTAMPNWQGKFFRLAQEPAPTETPAPTATPEPQPSDRHGDTYDTATTIRNKTRYVGSIEQGDVDYFTLTVP